MPTDPKTDPQSIRLENVRDRLQAIAKGIAAQLPPGHGFFLLTFDNQGPAQYVGNGYREDVVRAMQEFIARNPLQKQKNN